MATPSLTPIQLTEHTCKQGHYGDIIFKLPMGSMSVGPPGSGKTVLLTNMTPGIYKGCFSRVYIWSPSAEVDSTWEPVKDYIRDHIKPSDRENCFLIHMTQQDLSKVKNTTNVIDYQKRKHKDLYQILTVIGDFADGANLKRKSQLLHHFL